MTKGKVMEPIVKYTRPTRYDKHPRGTLWEVENSAEIYIQVNHDEDEPIWQPYGYVLQVAATKCEHSKRFIQKVLEIYDVFK